MPRTRSLETYPNRQFWALVQKALADNAAVLIPCTPGQAASMRGEMHAWRRAAESAPDQARQLGIDPAKLRDFALRVVKEPVSGMECLPQSMLVTPGLIEAALGSEVQPLQSPAAVALNRLMQNLGKDDQSGG